MTAAPLDTQLSPVASWLDDAGLQATYSARSWNDLAEERGKEWWIADGTEEEYARLRTFLEQTGLMEDYRVAERFIAALPTQGMKVADLAAGIGWTSSLISRLPGVAAVHAVDISQHRLELLFPQALRLFNGAADKLRRHLGSFYQLGFDDSSMDLVLMSSAFHHASNPLRLLVEIDRVLKPGGHLILIGENVIGSVAVVRRMIGMLLKQRRFCSNFYELFPSDDTWGDHYYRVSDYYMFMQMIGYRVEKFSVQPKRTAVLIAAKSHT